MIEILFYGIVKSGFKTSAAVMREGLTPNFISVITENPTAVIFAFKHKKTLRTDH